MSARRAFTILSLAALCAFAPSAHATSTASASSMLDWSSLSLVLTPDDTNLAPSDSYLTWASGGDYSASAVDMATWYWPAPPADDVYYDAWKGIDPNAPGDPSDAGNGWGAGNVSGNIGPVWGEGHTLPAIGTSANLNLTASDSYADIWAGAIQGGFITSTEAGWLEVSVDYSVSIALSSTDDALTDAEAYADFFIHNESDPPGSEDGDWFDLYHSAYNGSFSPSVVSGTWTGRVYLDAGDEAHFETYTDVFLRGDTSPYPVPEPASLGLLAMGLGGLAARRWRGVR